MSDFPEEEAKYDGPLLDSGGTSNAVGNSEPTTSGVGFSSINKQEEFDDYDYDEQQIEPVRKKQRFEERTNKQQSEINEASTSDIIKTEDLEIEQFEDLEKKAFERYKEIGRRICSISRKDFKSTQLPNEKTSMALSVRGDNVLTAVRRNLQLIKDRLGDLAEGTIFNHIDELCASFANADPSVLSKLNEMVAEKLRERAEAAKTVETLLASEPSSSNIRENVAGTSENSGQTGVTGEDLKVKQEDVEEFNY